MTIEAEEPGLGPMTTHVRVIALDATQMPTPEIRALARADVEVHDRSVSAFPPVARRFATLTDTVDGDMMTCTPATLCQTIWSPAPAVLVSWGPELWDAAGITLTRCIPKIDMAKVARRLWPDDDNTDPVPLAVRAGFRYPTEASESVTRRLATRTQAIVDLLGATVTLLGEEIVALAAGLDGGDPPAASDVVLGDLRGDPRLWALIRLSAEPMQPVAARLLGPWDEPRCWFAVAGEHLIWLADPERNSDSYTCDAAREELARRADRDAAMLQPRHPLRHPAPY
jgi:hypothetical protein